MNETSVHMHTRTDHTSGWVTLAGIMMIAAGVFHGIAGLFAIFRSGWYVVNESQLVLFNYTQWGWVHLIFGIVLVLAAAALFAGKTWGRAVAITLAVLSIIANLGYLWAYPLWSIIIIALDVMIIYGVAKHGKEVER